jgi:hypothetical protein
MTRVSGDDVLHAERACQRLVLRYADLIDAGFAGRVAELFDRDAVWESGPRRWVGIQEIRRGFAAREALPRVSAHLCGPLLFTLSSPDQAEGVTSYLLLRANPVRRGGAAQPSEWRLAGFYDDEFVRVDGEWLFAHRRAVVTFSDPA